MLSAKRCSELFADAALPKQEFLEIYRSKISLHRAKAGYSYPTIRLPHTFSKLVGLPTQIYQTIHDGALAFLVAISPSNSISENSAESPQSPALTWRRSPVRIRPSPLVLVFVGGSTIRWKENCTNHVSPCATAFLFLRGRVDHSRSSTSPDSAINLSLLANAAFIVTHSSLYDVEC